MTNDAKIGLVLGVAIVLVIGLVYFRGEPGPAPPSSAVSQSPAAPPWHPGPTATTSLRP